MNAPVRKFIETRLIRLDGDTQPREQIDEATVAEYAEAMGDGATFPAVVVFNDGSARWLADGFHRFHATRAAGLPTILVEEHAGTRRDAVLYGFQANIKHGLRETRADKRRKIEVMLRDDEWVCWSNSEIARRCGVTDKTVASVRAELVGRSEIPNVDTRTDSAGRQQPAAKTTASGEIRQIDARADDEAPPEQPVIPKPAEPTVEVTISTPAPAAEAPAAVVVKPAPDAEAERLRTENAALREQLAELASNLEEAVEEIEVLHRISDADDKIKAALAEVRRVTEHNRILEERIRGLTGENAEAIRLVKSWKRKAEAAEKLLKAKG